MNTAAHLAAGYVVAGRYRIERLLGRGGMGAVYAARDLRLGRRVALKTVLAGVESGDATARLRAEAEAVASLQHPGIVTLFDIVDDAGGIVLVMELVEGTSLREVLETGPLASRACADVIQNVAVALAAAHARGLVHRDVKPDNIMLRQDGRVALLDFGIAKALAPRLEATVTAEGATIGTPAYLAPEQARGERVGPATDQFALAVVAYELLAGRLPWPTDDYTALVAALLLAAPAPLVLATPALVAETNDALLRALAKAPADRFASVTQFADTLSMALRGERRPEDPSGALSLAETGVDTRLNAALARTEQAMPTPTTRTPPMIKSPRTRRVVAVLVALVAAGAVVVAMRIRSDARRAAERDDFFAELPFTPTSHVDAAAEARDALRKLEAGDIYTGIELLDSAVAHDASFLTARLQRVYFQHLRATPVQDQMRLDMAVVTPHRGELGSRDQDLLDALSPALADPPNWVEERTRMEAFVLHYPKDVQGWLGLGTVRTKQGDYDGAQAAFARLADVSPRVPGHYLWSQVVEATRGKADVDAILSDCMRRQPATIGCRLRRAQRLAAEGKCAEMENVGRDIMAAAPNARFAHALRAAAVMGQHGDVEAAAALLQAERERLRTDKDVAARLDRARLARFSGDLGQALEILTVGTAAGAPRLTAPEVRLRIELLAETGDVTRAAEEALARLRLTAAQPRPERPFNDDTALLLHAAARGGAITREELMRRREELVTYWQQRQTGSELRYFWWTAYASPATPEEARAALADAPRFGGVPLREHAHWSWVDPEPSSVGEILRMAGRNAEAIPYLEDSAHACSIEPRVVEWLRLGMAREATGDAANACSAYAEVERAWGAAKPRSVTAEAARARATHLGCEGRSR